MLEAEMVNFIVNVAGVKRCPDTAGKQSLDDFWVCL